ncbi:TPA: type 1 fimbrial protein [Morganella morganii]|nr:type 1 fimbrial protein [Morganella morganii]
MNRNLLKNNNIASRKLHFFSIILLTIVSVQVSAADTGYSSLNKDGNWSTEGANGKVYVYGSLTESTCSLSMESTYQVVSLDNIETAHFRNPGDRGDSVPVNLILTDCFDVSSRLLNEHSGNLVWDKIQPGVKIKFLADTDNTSPMLAKAEGITGIGFQLSDHQGSYLKFGEYNNAQLFISHQKANMTYYVTPVRTSNKLQAGYFFSTIAFNLTYD